MKTRFLNSPSSASQFADFGALSFSCAASGSVRSFSRSRNNEAQGVGLGFVVGQRKGWSLRPPPVECCGDIAAPINQ